MEDLCHGRPRDVDPFLGQAAFVEVSSGVFGVGQIDIRDDVHDASVGFLGEAFVFTPVPSFHMEDGDMEALGGDGGQAAVGIPQNEECIRHNLVHQLVGAIDDVAHGGAQIIPHGVHIDVGRPNLKVVEEDAV